MRVALVNPRLDASTRSIYFGCREPHLPLELGYCQGAAAKRRGTNACCSTAHLCGLDDDALAERGRRVRARHDGGRDGADLSVLALRAAGAARSARVPARARRDAAAARSRSVRMARSRRRRRLRKLGVDVVVRGECEEVVAELAEAGRLAAVPAIAFREGERDPRSPAVPHAGRFVDLPALDWPDDWVAAAPPPPPSLRSAAGRWPGAEVEASRGCPYTCSFCAKIDFRDNYRRRELRTAARGDRRADRAGRRLSLLHRRDLPAADSRCWRRWSTRQVQFGIQTRIDLWKPEMLDLLGRAGCVSIEAGVESLTRRGPRRARQELPHVHRRAGGAADPCAAGTCRSCRRT